MWAGAGRPHCEKSRGWSIRARMRCEQGQKRIRLWRRWNGIERMKVRRLGEEERLMRVEKEGILEEDNNTGKCGEANGEQLAYKKEMWERDASWLKELASATCYLFLLAHHLILLSCSLSSLLVFILPLSFSLQRVIIHPWCQHATKSLPSWVLP